MTTLMRRLQQFIVAPSGETADRRMKLWMGLAFGVAATYATLGLLQAFSGPYVVQDDARQHVFWMLRFIDPDLFPNDMIADYFQSLSPAGYSAFYWVMARVGLNPLFANKLLPMVLGFVTTGYCFAISMRLLRVPAAGFLSTVLLNQHLWSMKATLIAGTQRAFLYPLFLAFLYYLLRGSLIPCLVAILLQGLFYPQMVFISAGVLILRLVDWNRWPVRLSGKRSDYVFCAAGLGVALLVMLVYALRVSEFGPVITASAARVLPEFLEGGRSPFFYNDPVHFWILRGRSGMQPHKALIPALMCAGLVLPLLLRFRARVPLMRHVARGVTLLPQIVLASLGVFFVAHALLFTLHLPNRYTVYTLPIVTALAAGIALVVLLEVVFRWAQQRTRPHLRGRQLCALGVTVLLGSALILYPVLLRANNIPFPRTRYKVGQAVGLYEFFSRQPKDILIASLAAEADNLPTFAQRSVLVAREYAIPYHVGYYGRIRQRATDLIHAQYSPDLEEVRRFIQTYGVDFWLLDRGAFTPEYVGGHAWMRLFQPAATEAASHLEQGVVPALATLQERCAVFETERFIVLHTECVANE